MSISSNHWQRELPGVTLHQNTVEYIQVYISPPKLQINSLINKKKKKRCWCVVSWGFGRELRGLLYSSPVLLLSIKNEKLAQTGKMIFQPGCFTWSRFLRRASVALKPQGTFLWGSLVDLHKTIHCYKSKIQRMCWFTLGCCLQESFFFFQYRNNLWKANPWELWLISVNKE